MATEKVGESTEMSAKDVKRLTENALFTEAPISISADWLWSAVALSRTAEVLLAGIHG
jgi:hypothetical protein